MIRKLEAKQSCPPELIGMVIIFAYGVESINARIEYL
jgi:hypothetical protein